MVQKRKTERGKRRSDFQSQRDFESEKNVSLEKQPSQQSLHNCNQENF